MSSNVYEDPNFTMNVKYSKGAREDGGERVERLVDIYESVDTEHRVLTQDEGAHTQRHLPGGQRNPFRAAALVLGLLCLLLVVGVTVVSKLYFTIFLEKDQLSLSYKNLETRYDNLSNSLCHETGNQTQGDITGWRRFQCSCYYKSTAMKNWTESRRDCERRGAHLVIINSNKEQDFVRDMSKGGAFWIGLQSEKVWQSGWEWKWVDGATSMFRAWKTGVNQTPVNGSTAYIDVGGTWNHTNTGSKRWICEKKINHD